MLQLQPARLDLGEIQDVIDEFAQCSRGIPDRLHQLQLRRSQGGMGQQIDTANDTMDRGADFVTHGGQKLTLGSVGGFRPLTCFLQLLSALGHDALQMVAVALQRLHQILFFRDVFLHTEIMSDPPVGLSQGRDGRQFGVDAPALTLVDERPRPGALGAQCGPEFGKGGRWCLPGMQQARILADQFLARVAADRHEGVIDIFDATVEVGDEDAHRGALDDLVELMQTGLGLPASVDVARD